MPATVYVADGRHLSEVQLCARARAGSFEAGAGRSADPGINYPGEKRFLSKIRTFVYLKNMRRIQRLNCDQVPTNTKRKCYKGTIGEGEFLALFVSYLFPSGE